MKTNYQVTIGYKAIISVDVKAENEKEAKEIALKTMRKRADIMGRVGVDLQDDNYSADGVLNLDKTWNQF